MRLGRPVYSYTILFSLLLLASILFANTIMVFISMIPFLLLMANLILKVPDEIEVNRTIPSNRIFTDRPMEIMVEIVIKTGIGMVSVCDVLPNGVQLVSGSNLVTLWKGFGEKKVSMLYVIKSGSPGTVCLSKIAIEARHSIYGLSKNSMVSVEQTIEVIPTFFAYEEIKSLPGASKIPMPNNAMAVNGIPTLDFKEIRLYSYGDSFKYINWKASSRNIYRGYFWPVINEYDKEGKKNVWLFLDTSNVMNCGSSIKSLFDYGLEAVCQLSNYYIKQQCQVAFCTYNLSKTCIAPGTGEVQYHKILGEVLSLSKQRQKISSKSLNKSLGLSDVISTYKKFIAKAKSLFVVITSFTQLNEDEIKKGINELSRYTVNRDGHCQVMVINIIRFDLEAQNEFDRKAAQFLRLRNRKLTEEVRKGCLWVDWNPSEGSLFSALIKQVV